MRITVFKNCLGVACPREVVWRAVDVKLPQSIGSCLRMFKMIVPDHLAEAGIEQYEVTALLHSFSDLLSNVHWLSRCFFS